MRIVTALLLLLLVPAALAQPCDPAQTDEACPDTTTWQRYFPLDVGNTWQYRDAFFDEPVSHWSWTITGEADVGGQTYFELERCDEAADGSATCADPVLLRYDAEHAMVVRRDGDEETWWNELPCGMEADFNVEYGCAGPGTGGTTFDMPFGVYGAYVPVPPDEVSGDTQKQFDWLFVRGWEVFAGLGVTKFYYELQGEPTRLVYANVGGEQVGTPAFASCDPADAGDIACPDTTDWRSYFPLEVGNQWQYEFGGFCGHLGQPPCRSGLEIVGTEEREGVEYFLLRTCREQEEGEVTCFDPYPVRYDTATRTVVFEGLNGTVYDAISACDLSFPFNFESSEVYCEAENGLDGYWAISGDYGRTFSLGEGPSVYGSLKNIVNIGAARSYFSGIGPISSQGDGTFFPETLVYARTAGVEYGTPAFVFPTAGEPDAAQPTRTTFTALFPNPARDAATAHYTLDAPQAVTLELIDLLGRRVRSAEMGPQAAGAHDVRIDMRGLRPGLYVLRLRGEDGAEAARRVVVVR